VLRHSKRVTDDENGKEEQKDEVYARAAMENITIPLNFDTISGILFTDFHTTLHFANQRNYKTPAVQTHALARMRCFYSPNVTISHPTVKQGLGYLSVRA
jgi:hypothetical protein